MVGADSLQVYKHFNIGSAKPSADAMSAFPHFMIDVVEPDDEFNAGAYRTLAHPILKKLCAEKTPPIVVGGTFLYVRALLEGLIESPADPEIRKQLEDEEKIYGTDWLYEKLRDSDAVSAVAIHQRDSVRIRRALEIFYSTGTPASQVRRSHGFSDGGFDCLKIGLTTDRDALVGEINRRTQEMFDGGIIEETEQIRGMGYSRDLKPMKAIGYRQANMLIDGEITKTQSVEDTATDTRRFAKRQMTWLRKEKDIRWFVPEKLSEAVEECRKFLSA